MLHPDEPLVTVGGWRLEGLIGEGSVGEVHRARHVQTGQPAALKLLRAAGDEARRRFAAEAAVAARLHHPDIVRVFGAGEDRGTAWLAMELLAGCDLVRYTRASRLLPEAVVLAIGERVAGALAYAHGQGVVHRDVKPSNVIVDWVTPMRVTLTDFGIASVADGERTRTGVVLGTPAYMAPEQLAGAPATAAADLYALGAMLYELLTGRLPHAGATLGELLRRAASEPVADVRTFNPAVPAPAAALVGALLEREPSARPPGAAAVAATLRPLAAPAAQGPKSRT